MADTPRSGLSRRDAIKAAGIAGAAAWTAPVIIDSLSSPAAAASATCASLPVLTGKTIVQRQISSSTTTTQATASITTAASTQVVVFIATSNGSGASNSSVVSVTGNPITGAAQRASILNYGSDNTRTHDLFAWSGTGGGTGAITVTFSASNPPEAITIAVWEITVASNSTPIAVTGSDPLPGAASVSASTAAYGVAPLSNTAEVWVTAGSNGSSTSNPVGPPAGWTEPAGFDVTNNPSSNSRAFQFESAGRATALTASGTFTYTSAVNWAAIRLQFHC